MKTTTVPTHQPRVRLFPVLTRLLSLLALSTAGVFATAAPSHAAGPRALTIGDFGDRIGARNVSGKAAAVVSGVRYARAIRLGPDDAYLTYFTHHIPGYTALSFALGVADTEISAHCQADIKIDGTVVRAVTARQGLVAIPETIPFGAASEITIFVTMKYAPCWLTIGNPTLMP